MHRVACHDVISLNVLLQVHTSHVQSAGRNDSWDDSYEEAQPKPARAGAKRKASALASTAASHSTLGLCDCSCWSCWLCRHHETLRRELMVNLRLQSAGSSRQQIFMTSACLVS